MKKEQLYELIGEIKEDEIKEAEKAPVKKKSHFRIGYIAAAAACFAVIAGAGIWYLGSRGNDMLLAAASYPEMPKYPTEIDMDAFDEYEKARRKLLVDQPSGYNEGFNEFFMNTTGTFMKNTDGKNKVYSPLSLYMALSMSAEITDGNSRRQILDVLAHDDIDTLRSHARSMWEVNYADDGLSECILASSLWTSDKFSYNMDTVNRTADNYYSSVYSGDPASDKYNEAFREWLNDQTGGLLSSYTDDIKMEPDTILAIASTVRYSGKWSSKFNKDLTKPAVFHSPEVDVRCDFMNQETDTTYYWGDNFSSVVLDIDENGRMRLILPDEGVTPEELLSDEAVLKYMSGGGDVSGKYLEVSLSLPKFDVSSGIDLTEGLKELGITDIFDMTLSDFSPLSSNDSIFLQKAEQDARVTIDEDGCKASAMTTLMYGAGAGVPDDHVDFIIDRPFIFEIESRTGYPVFVGIVNQP